MRAPHGLRFIDPLKMTRQDFDPFVIAKAQSRINRWCGNGLFTVSDAQHSATLSYLVPAHLRFAALMHDVPENWCGDVCGPLLATLGKEIDAYQHSILKHLSQLFDYPYQFFIDLHPYDKRIAYDEKIALFPEDHTDPSLGFGIPIEPLDAAGAEALWVHRFFDLVDDRGSALQLWQAAA